MIDFIDKKDAYLDYKEAIFQKTKMGFFKGAHNLSRLQ